MVREGGGEGGDTTLPGAPQASCPGCTFAQAASARSQHTKAPMAAPPACRPVMCDTCTPQAQGVVWKLPVAYPGDRLGGEVRGKYGVLTHMTRLNAQVGRTRVGGAGWPGACAWMDAAGAGGRGPGAAVVGRSGVRGWAGLWSMMVLKQCLMSAAENVHVCCSRPASHSATPLPGGGPQDLWPAGGEGAHVWGRVGKGMWVPACAM